MSATRITSEPYQSDILRCERCNTALPIHATFCGQCGARIENVAANGAIKDKTEFTDQYRITSLVRRGPYTRIARALDIQQQQPVIICDIDLNALGTKERVQATNLLQQEYDLLRSQQISYTVPLIGLRSSAQHLYMVSAWPDTVQQEKPPIQQSSTLQEMLQSGVGLPDERTALLWMQHLSQAVAELHRHQLLFADLDPQMIIVPGTSYQGDAALLLSCVPISLYSLFSSTLHSTNTTTFSAPEVQRGEAELRSDVYSLGAILYFLLTGVPPTTKTTRIRRRIRTPRDINPRVHSAVNTVVMQAIANSTTERIQSAEKLAQTLANLYADPRTVQNTHTLQQNKLSVSPKSAPIPANNTPVALARNTLTRQENVPSSPQERTPVQLNDASILPTQALPTWGKAPAPLNDASILPTQALTTRRKAPVPPNDASILPTQALPTREYIPVKPNSIFNRQENTLTQPNTIPTEQRSPLVKQQSPQEEEIKISSPADDNKSTGNKPTQQSPGLDDVTISIVPLQAQMARRYLSRIKTGQTGTQEQAAGEAIVEEGSSKKNTTGDKAAERDTKKLQPGKTLDALDGKKQSKEPASAPINPESPQEDEASSAATLQTQASASMESPLTQPETQALPTSTAGKSGAVAPSAKESLGSESNGTTPPTEQVATDKKAQSAKHDPQGNGQQKSTQKTPVAQDPQDLSKEPDHNHNEANTTTSETSASRLGENREKAIARLKDIFTGSLPAIPRITPPKLPSSHAPQSTAEVNSQPAAEISDEKEDSLLKRMQRFILGEQQHSTTAAALIETPLRIQPNQSYSIRINIMGRKVLKHEDATAGLSGMVEGDIAHIEVRSALYQNYAYIVQQADVQVPAEGYVAEVTMPMQPLSSGPSGRRERLHIFFMDAARTPLYEKPFVIELFISHLVQTGREGHSVLSIPL